MDMIQFRPVCKDDFADIRQILCEIWHFDRYTADPKVLDAMLNAFLQGYLLHQNYSNIAIQDGTVVGFLLGKCETLPRAKHRIRYLFSLLKNILVLSFTRDGRSAFRIQRKLTVLGETLLKGRRGEFDGELVLFATDPSVRGAGIGKKLLADFNAYLKANGAKNACLLTDSFCNFGFYEYLGYARASQVSGYTGAEPDGGGPTEFYLYTYRV